MAAKELSVFFNAEVSKELKKELQSALVNLLKLEVDSVPNGSPYEFSAQRLVDPRFRIEFDANARDVIEELSSWEKPSRSIKEILAGCKESATIHYRNPGDVRKCLLTIGKTIDELANKCVVENGFGCLFILSEFVNRLESDAAWTWDRESFPELTGVANSEWLD